MSWSCVHDHVWAEWNESEDAAWPEDFEAYNRDSDFSVPPCWNGVHCPFRYARTCKYYHPEDFEDAETADLDDKPACGLAEAAEETDDWDGYAVLYHPDDLDETDISIENTMLHRINNLQVTGDSNESSTSWSKLVNPVQHEKGVYRDGTSRSRSPRLSPSPTATSTTVESRGTNLSRSPQRGSSCSSTSTSTDRSASPISMKSSRKEVVPPKKKIDMKTLAIVRARPAQVKSAAKENWTKMIAKRNKSEVISRLRVALKGTPVINVCCSSSEEEPL